MPNKKEVKRELRKIYNGGWSIHTKKRSAFSEDFVCLNRTFVTAISLSNDTLQSIIIKTVKGLTWFSHKPLKIKCQLKCQLKRKQ